MQLLLEKVKLGIIKSCDQAISPLLESDEVDPAVVVEIPQNIGSAGSFAVMPEAKPPQAMSSNLSSTTVISAHAETVRSDNEVFIPPPDPSMYHKN